MEPNGSTDTTPDRLMGMQSPRQGVAHAEHADTESDTWTLVESVDCSERSFSPAVDANDSPRSDIAADLVLGQPLPLNASPRLPGVNATLRGADSSKVGRARDAGVHVPDLLADLTPRAMVVAAASVWMGLARAWLGSACEAVAAVRAATMVVARAAVRDVNELSQAMMGAARSGGGMLEAALGASHAASASAWRTAAEKAVRLQASFAKGNKWQQPAPGWVLLSLGLVTTTSVAAAATLAMANRSLACQLRDRDRELAFLVCKIVGLQDALQNSRAGGPMLRHVSLSPAFPGVPSLS